VIKYLGSKRLLTSTIVDAVAKNPGACSVIDLFSGTSRVGHALKRAGYRVLSNDHNAYATTLARCYVEADAQDVLPAATLLVNEFNALAGESGYFTETFCEQSRFFQPKNGRRIDAIREAIARKCLDSELEAVMLVSLMEAADRVDSTTGVQMAYLKSWSARSHNDLLLRVPEVLHRAPHGKGSVTALDALDAAKTLDADVTYIDPPYNQHSYLGNYHIWESLVLWDKPPHYGIACKREDVRQRQSVFNSRPKFADAMRQVLHSVRTHTVIVSFSNEGYLSPTEMQAILGSLWDHQAIVATLDVDYKRYVGAQIGIHNARGEKVGRVSHLRNTEHLYVASRAN